MTVSVSQPDATTTGISFELGCVVATPGAIDALEASHQQPHEFLRRHHSGDWGELDDHDRSENELALKHDLRILSAYRTTRGARLWVITEADRSSTIR
ncbi:MAG: hypothetical protein H0W76_07905 [Pyrinomonadaceae bacterium]|nr:hypothetical protein [Pyrinomonadaceae bacterium]